MDKSNFVVDIGNSRIKSGWVSGGQVSDIQLHQSIDELVDFMPRDTKAMICSVGVPNQLVKEKFAGFTYRIFQQDTPVPFEVTYATPRTLGLDRLAAVAGAQYHFPKEPCLIVDAGSCITYDWLDQQGVYRGGIISPGVGLRYRAMHAFTSGLPQLDVPDGDVDLVGRSTADCMHSGVINGIQEEMDGIVRRFLSDYGEARVILTGGDARIFETRIKNPIFADPNLVLIGLNQILIFNEDA